MKALQEVLADLKYTNMLKMLIKLKTMSLNFQVYYDMYDENNDDDDDDDDLWKYFGLAANQPTNPASSRQPRAPS